MNLSGEQEGNRDFHPERRRYFAQGPMKGRRGIIEPVSGRAQLPNPAGFSGIPFAVGAKKNLATKAILAGRGVLDIQAPNWPHPQDPQRYHLRMGRPATHTARNIRIALTQYPPCPHARRSLPFATNPALAASKPCTSFHVNTHRVSTRFLYWAPIITGEKTLNCSHASNSPLSP